MNSRKDSPSAQSAEQVDPVVVVVPVAPAVLVVLAAPVVPVVLAVLAAPVVLAAPGGEDFGFG